MFFLEQINVAMQGTTVNVSTLYHTKYNPLRSMITALSDTSLLGLMGLEVPLSRFPASLQSIMGDQVSACVLYTAL